MNSAAKAQDRRTIYLNSVLGRRQIREVLGSLLSGMILYPEDVWLVSPWLSDFELLDNRGGDWKAVDPSWGHRWILFSEVLQSMAEAGCFLRVVTSNDEHSREFLRKISSNSTVQQQFATAVSTDLHVKGLLASHFFLSGSMNFTYSGTNVNEEQVQLDTVKDSFFETRLEFEYKYKEILK